LRPRSLQNGGNTEPVKFLPKQLNSFGSTAAVFEFERCQRGWLSEDLDLEINQLMDFSLDGSGWGCHHEGLLWTSLAEHGDVDT